MNTDHWFVYLVVPKYGADDTFLSTVAASYTESLVQANTTLFQNLECVSRTHLGAWGIVAGSTDYDDETMLHAAVRPDSQAGTLYSHIVLPSCAGEHAQLTSHTSLRIQDC
jgi:hypothetical protein